MKIDGVYGTSEYFAIDSKVRREEPDIWWRYTWGESPTDKRVRPSGDTDADGLFELAAGRIVQRMTYSG